MTRGLLTSPYSFLIPTIGLGLSTVVACAPPDRPNQLLPSAAEALAAPDTARSLRVTEGVRYRFLWLDEGPWAVHLLEVDLGRCELGLTVLRGAT